MPSRRRVVLVALVLAGASPVLGWGKTGHPIVNRLAVEVLPEGDLKRFLFTHREWLADHALDADRRKASHRVDEAPRHYIHACDRGRIEDYPRTWSAAVEKFGFHEATRNGRLPWVIDEVFEELVNAFRAQDGPGILRHAAWLGHYVADAHAPLHACAKHDGAPGQKGIHALWEEVALANDAAQVEKEARRLACAMRVVEVQADVAAWAFDRLIAGDRLAHELIDKDKGKRGPDREKALYKATGAIAHRRLAEAANGLACLWHSAWVRAGRPAFPSGFAVPEGEASAGGDVEDHEPVTVADVKKAMEAKPAEPAKEEPARPEAPKGEPAKPTKPSPRAVKCGVPGLWVRDDDDQPGAIVDFVDDASAAQLAGALPGDVVIAIDGAPVNSVGTLKKRLSDYKSGDSVPITVLRAGAESFIRIRLP